MKFDSLQVPFGLQKKYLKFCGFWPTKSSTTAYFCYGVFVHFVLVDCLIVLQVLYLLKSKTFDDLTQVISITATDLLMFLKLANFLLKVEKVEELFKKIKEANGEFGEGKELKNMKFIDKICRSIWLQTFTISLLTSTMTPLTTSELSTKLWYPFNFENGGIVFWAIASYQIVNMCVFSGIDVILELLPTIFLGAVLDLLEQLTAKIEKLSENEMPDVAGSSGNAIKAKKTSEKLKNCVEFHLKILQIVKNVEEIFSPVLLAHAVTTCLILCTSAYKLSTVSLYTSPC
jgi:hypothetical protein